MDRHTYAPLSVAVFAGRLFWVDPHYSGEILHCRIGDTRSRNKIILKSIDGPLTAIAAVDKTAQPLGHLRNITFITFI